MFEYNEKLESWILESIAKKWKEFKHSIKRNHYSPNLSLPWKDRLNKRDNRVSIEQWEMLIHYWDSEESKVCIFT